MTTTDPEMQRLRGCGVGHPPGAAASRLRRDLAAASTSPSVALISNMVFDDPAAIGHERSFSSNISAVAGTS
jgi:hypothetical protein